MEYLKSLQDRRKKNGGVLQVFPYSQQNGLIQAAIGSDIFNGLLL